LEDIMLKGSVVLGAVALMLVTSSASADLTKTSVDRFGDGDLITHFEQTHHGIPVIGRGATVRTTATGRVIARREAIANDLPSSIVPTVSPANAATIAANATRLRPAAGDAHLVVWPTRDRGARLAWAVVPRTAPGLPYAVRVVVDAQTGEVIEARNAVVFAGLVRSYEFNPQKTPTVQDFPLSLVPTGSTLSHPFLEASNCIDQKTVKPVNMFGFDMKLHVCDLVQVAHADASGDFLFNPADDPGSVSAKKDEFSEASIYYHAAKAYTFFRTLQGNADAQVVVDKPLKVIANLQVPAGVTSGNLSKASDPDLALEPFQNAFFSPAGGGLGQLFQQLYGFDQGALWFGQGPQRDYAYDGDVVYHEFGHAVVDKTLRLGAWTVDSFGAIDAPGAMNEGLADYFSSAITGDPDVGEYASKDFAGGASVIRTLANEDKCPTAIIGEVHYDSTLFSGALWSARASLPEGDRSKFDATLYKAMLTNPNEPDLGYSDLGQLFLATLKTDMPAGATALEKALTDRAILPSCSRVFTWADKAIASPEKGFGFASPGTQTVGMSKIAPGILQVSAKVPKGATTMTVTFSAREGGGNPTDVLGGSSTPFTPVVLAKWGKAITWTPKAKTPHDAEVNVAAEGTTSRTATIEIPVAEDGTAPEAVFLQIANTGESDGSYDNVAVAFDVTPAGEGDGTTPTTDPNAGTGAQTSESGCACSTPGTSTSTSSAAAGMFGLALAFGALTRRRRS
jgi:MYXO-CTERM domain-containing protein